MSSVKGKKPLNDAEFKGYVTRALEENDGSHKAIFEKLDKIDKKVNDLRVSSAKGGILGGAIMTGLAFLGLWIKGKL